VAKGNGASRALFFIGLGIAAAIGVVALLRTISDAGQAQRVVPVVVLLAAAALTLITVGLRGALRPGGAGASYRHSTRLLVLIGVILLVGLVARHLAIPETYGQRGAFRGTAAREARQRAPRHQGEQACRECHDEEAKLHAKDAHSHVQCETCHGEGRRHVKDPDTAKLAKPGAQADCLGCHQMLPARPGPFPQIVVEEHYRFVGVKDTTEPCTRCHSPHEPLYMDRDLRTARLHPLIHRCRDCHQGPTRNPAMVRPADHPAIFECRYCHSALASDFAKRPHAKVRCTTCHVFFRTSEFAGRIIRDADPRFCLLCHKAGEFRSENAPPGIAWPSHREDMSQGPEDKAKRCVDCHRDRIHITGGQP